MPRGKSLGADGITVELLPARGPTLYTAPARRFSQYFAKCEVPVAWKQSSTILFFKNGDKEDLKNYRPVTLLPVLYTVFTRCILTCSWRTLDEARPIEEARSSRIPAQVQHTRSHNHLLSIDRSRPGIARTTGANIHRLQEGI
ncbi:hypothetical protein ANCDUO_11181 [Ancylostoma duodenale]|uniref:Uncharacterized protein n=1 Tax=Ancylostoma duodenale TaxID=51022 RepID=A0A0C2GI95_9BILA|nr:hypothetical protein ANCDUO_11181 [Ancylostoma duodenale]